MDLLEAVYGFRPEIPGGGRTEFSVHPKWRGFRATRTLLWEHEVGTSAPTPAGITWPHRFSRHIGDKLYGLLIAHLLGLKVPLTLAICRRVAPFSFGCPTGSEETWTRTCPVEQEPGLFTTLRGWTDPFALLTREDPSGGAIASVLSQAAVPASHSGAAAIAADGSIIVEGVAGEGDLFMLAKRAPEPLPAQIVRDVESACTLVAAALTEARLEWVHDGASVWIVQLHAGAPAELGAVLVPGEPLSWRTFDVSQGLPELRRTLASLDQGEGLILQGSFGLTSHIADLVRKAGVPARAERHD